MTPSLLSRQLRQGSSPFLRNRRAVAGLGLLAAGSMGLITLYQMGLIRHLPEPRLPGLDADRVDAAPEAYARMRLPMPDAPLGLVSYATTIALASAGGLDRSRTHPWLPIALLAKTAIDALQAGKLTWEQWDRHRAFCSWCLLAAGATAAALPLTIPEARDGLDRLIDELA
ncbi:vitamin K epoxide reductase family protein [Tautonia plasticadhaerens]|uniref:Vitamin K epoxide reductase family protein n=1 Tax=Tautonia plasticadhaerens TaxID=2527974 RepID=A0A518GXR0_9BACT|nr:vitamin K epoxide reductase family protein [Tautonia plasticadhaerens]QDV33377.1 Vitamin K epoxide reductase family protein [Tautonia plasticadhaerens]